MDHIDADWQAWRDRRDGEALERLLTASLDRAYAQAMRLLGSSADAQDAVQNAQVSLLKPGQRWPDAVPFAAIFARLVYESAMDLARARQRRDRRHHRHAQDQPMHTPEEQPDVPAEAVRAALADLPEPHRQVLALRYFAGLEMPDLAATLGITVNALGVRLHRARENLRVLLQQRGVALGAVMLVSLLDSTAHAAQASLTPAPPSLLAHAHDVARRVAATQPATASVVTSGVAWWGGSLILVLGMGAALLWSTWSRAPESSAGSMGGDLRDPPNSVAAPVYLLSARGQAPSYMVAQWRIASNDLAAGWEPMQLNPTDGAARGLCWIIAAAPRPEGYWPLQPGQLLSVSVSSMSRPPDLTMRCQVEGVTLELSLPADGWQSGDSSLWKQRMEIARPASGNVNAWSLMQTTDARIRLLELRVEAGQ